MEVTSDNICYTYNPAKVPLICIQKNEMYVYIMSL